MYGITNRREENNANYTEFGTIKKALLISYSFQYNLTL